MSRLPGCGRGPQSGVGVGIKLKNKEQEVEKRTSFFVIKLIPFTKLDIVFFAHLKAMA